MDAIVSAAGSALVSQAVPASPEIASSVVPPQAVQPASSVNADGANGSRRHFEQALHGEGGQVGLLRRVSAEEIETVQEELGLKGHDASRLQVAEQAPVARPSTEPVDAIPVEAANVDVQPRAGIVLDDGPGLLFDVREAFPEPREDPAPPTGDGIVTITEFVQAGLQADTDT